MVVIHLLLCTEVCADCCSYGNRADCVSPLSVAQTDILGTVSSIENIVQPVFPYDRTHTHTTHSSSPLSAGRWSVCARPVSGGYREDCVRNARDCHW